MQNVGYEPLMQRKWKLKGKDKVHRLATEEYVKNKHVKCLTDFYAILGYLYLISDFLVV